MASESAASLEIDRYIALPAQFLSYKIANSRFPPSVPKPRKLWAPSFDIRAYDEILKDGAMPLDLFEVKMDAWIGNH